MANSEPPALVSDRKALLLHDKIPFLPENVHAIWTRLRGTPRLIILEIPISAPGSKQVAGGSK